MKKLIFFLLLSIKYAPIPVRNYAFKDIFITPIIENENNKITFAFENKGGGNITIYSRVSYLDNLEEITLFSKNIGKVVNYEDYFYINTKYIENDNTFLNFSAWSDYQEVTNVSFTLFKRTNNYITIKNDDSFYDEVAGQYTDNLGRRQYFEESISFEGVNDYYEANSFYIDLDFLVIDYYSQYDPNYLENKVVNLEIIDEENIFPLISNINGKKVFEFELHKKENEKFYLSLRDKIYLNKTTNLISKENKEGFVRVDRIYIPKNRSTRKLDLELKFTNFGYQNLLLNMYFVYEFAYNLIGACSSSLNCIEINESNYYPPNSERIEVKI